MVMADCPVWIGIGSSLDSCLLEGNESAARLLPILEPLTRLVANEEFRRGTIPRFILSKLLMIINESGDVRAVTECLRTLRNCAGANWHDFPDCWESLFVRSVELLRLNVVAETGADSVQLKVLLQLVGNMINRRQELAERIWNSLPEHFSNLLVDSDDKVVLYSSAVLYGVLKNSRRATKEITEPQWASLLSSVIRSSHNGVLYSRFTVELYLADAHLFEILYDSLELDCRLLLIHQVCDTLEDNQFSVGNWQFITKLYTSRSDLILRTCESSANDLQAVEVSILLELLAKGCASDECRNELQRETNLTATTIDLLKSIHSLGRAAQDNYFSAVNDHFTAVDDHPALGFKANLVKLLANLSFQNKDNQDLIREMEAIPVLLECSNIDARNPFIQQESILAIRNILQGNAVNQELISSLTRMNSTDSWPAARG